MKLYVTDLDGTLMTHIDGLDDPDRQRLVALLESGFPLTFATGRVIPSGLKALGHPRFRYPMIGHGGGVTQHPDGEVLYQALMPTATVAEALRRFQEAGLGLTLVLAPEQNHGRRWWRPEGFRGMDKFVESRAWDPSFKPLDDGVDLEGLRVVSMSCCGEPSALEPVVEWVGSRADLDLEIVHDPYLEGVQVGFLNCAGTSKGRALRGLMEHLGLAADEVCVLGDGANDLSLFRAAGRRVAPAGACAEILELADEVLSANTSVLDFLEAEAARLARASV